MKATKQFIEDAIAGGYDIHIHGFCEEWKPRLIVCSERLAYFETCDGGRPYRMRYLSEFLLDPEVWQAVGKTRGWNEPEKLSQFRKMGWNSTWIAFWHCFIDHLADGKTINEALQAIE